MKTILFAIFLLPAIAVFPQKGDELLVYSLSGDVRVVENNAESKLRIGKVLKQGSTVKTRRAAKLTMVCKQGKPISVTREGSFPVEQWKDSCEIPDNSITTKYFQFIWDQLYVRSDDYRKDHPGEPIITEAPVRGEEDQEIFVSNWFDSIYYASGSFPLTWNTKKRHPGKFHFLLKHVQTGKRLYSDSLTQGYVDLERIRKLMRAANVYEWIVTTRGSESAGGYIKMISTGEVSREVNKLKKLVNVPEDPASLNFRLGYLLQQKGYLPTAYTYYVRAANSSADTPFYQEQLREFKKEFNLK